MSTHPHSREAYDELQVAQKLPRRAAAIYKWMLAHPGAWTDREIAARMGYPDMNCVRPRLTEMVQWGLLIEADAILCPLTRKRVRRTMPTDPQAELF